MEFPDVRIDTGTQKEGVLPKVNNSKSMRARVGACPSSWTGEYLVGVDGSASPSTGQSGLPIAPLL